MPGLIPRFADDPEWNHVSNQMPSVVAMLKQAYQSLADDDPCLDDFLEALAVLEPIAEKPMPDLLRIQVMMVLAMVAGAEGDGALFLHYTKQVLDITQKVRV